MHKCADCAEKAEYLSSRNPRDAVCDRARGKATDTVRASSIVLIDSGPVNCVTLTNRPLPLPLGSPSPSSSPSPSPSPSGSPSPSPFPAVPGCQ